MTTIVELVQRIRKLEETVSKPAVALLFASEVDRLYRLQEGTAAAAAAAGLVPSVRRSRCGRPCYLITPKDALKRWGPR